MSGAQASAGCDTVTDLSNRLHPTLLQVVYEDEHMACIVKPQGIPTAQVWHGSVAYIHPDALQCVGVLPAEHMTKTLSDIMQ